MALISSIIKCLSSNFTSKIRPPQLQIPFVNYSNYKSSPFVEDITPRNVKCEVTKNPDEWMYVERALPLDIVPQPIKKDSYPSGWKPQGENLKDRPYFIERTKNHMMPVYLKIGQRGLRKHTIVKKVQGDIWVLEQELREFLQPQSLKPLRLQVNEFAGLIRMNGDFVNAIKYFLEQKDY